MLSLQHVSVLTHMRGNVFKAVKYMDQQNPKKLPDISILGLTWISP